MWTEIIKCPWSAVNGLGKWLRWLFCTSWLVLGLSSIGHAQVDVAERNAMLMRERQALHIGTMAYLYGYPVVDMRKQMFNETHRVADKQAAYAPVNHFYAYEYLVTPQTAGNLRGPNNDTLYFGGWFDLAKEPVIVHAPDTAGRYYTMAVTDFYAESHHVGRRTTGSNEKFFALVGPDWKGDLPVYLHVVRVPTPQVWILGRMLVDGEKDRPEALGLIRKFWAAPMSQFKPDGPPPVRPAEQPAKAVDPMGKLDFFVELNAWLQTHPGEKSEAALMGLFDQIGIGPNRKLDLSKLDEASRKGLEQAVVEGESLVQAASQRAMEDVRNGWIFPTGLGRYGFDYLVRAAVVKGGYANAAEESTYAAKMFDDDKQLLTGANRYQLHLKPEQIPPAGAFWSLVAYDLKTAGLIENSIHRYSLGDRTPGIQKNADGSLDLWIQKNPPDSGVSNWLPVSDAPFFLIIRIYEPKPAVFDGSYKPGPLLKHTVQ